MNRLILPAFILASVAVSPAMAQTSQLRGFDNVHAEGRFRVEVGVGPEYRVDVTGPDAARIRTYVDGDTLEIKPAHRGWFDGNPHYSATVHVTLPELEGVSAARGAVVEATAGGACSQFEAVAAMGGVLDIKDLQCRTIDATAAMGASLSLAGDCERLDVTAAMGGVVEASGLRCGAVDASAAMGGDVAAYASTSYDASASMGGNIDISGEAQAGERSTAMGGAVTHRN